MELSEAVIRGLQVAGTSSVSDDAFRKITSFAVSAAENPSKSSKVPAIEDQAVAKEVFSALTTLLLEAARTDTDAAGLSSVLEDCKFAPDRSDALQAVYTDCKERLRASMAKASSSLPRVVDIDWKLDYHIKSNNLERIDKAVYLINLKTEEPGSSEPKIVQFACTQEQLQDLVSKLKDANKSLEKFSQQ